MKHHRKGNAAPAATPHPHPVRASVKWTSGASGSGSGVSSPMKAAATSHDPPTHASLLSVVSMRRHRNIVEGAGEKSPMVSSRSAFCAPGDLSAASAVGSGVQAALFHQQVSKMRKMISGTSSFHAARARRLWRVAIAAVRVACRLRRAARVGVKLSHAEREHLYRCYWTHSQQAGGLFHADSIGRLLQEFNQPQPPTTVEQLLAHVRYNASETQTRPIAFGQVVQMLMQLKRAHRTQSRVSDEEELFQQLSTAVARSGSTPNGDVGGRPMGDAHHPAWAQGADNPPTRVDASAVSGILKAFDLRVMPPERFVAPAAAVPLQPSSPRGAAPKPSAMPAAGDGDATLSFDEFQTFLRQTPPRDGAAVTADPAALRRHGQPSALNSSNFSGRFQPWEVSSTENSPIANSKSPTQATATVSPNQLNERSAGHPHLQPSTAYQPGRPDSSAVVDNPMGSVNAGAHASQLWGGASSGVYGPRGSGGARLEDIDAVNEIEMLVEEGYSQDLVDVKQKLRATNRRILSWHRTHQSDQRFRAMESEAERVSASGNWVLKQRPVSSSNSKRRHPARRTSGHEQLQLVRTHVVRDLPTKHNATSSHKLAQHTSSPARTATPPPHKAPRLQAHAAHNHSNVAAIPRPQSAAPRVVATAHCEGRPTASQHSNGPHERRAASRQQRPRSAQPIVHSGLVVPTNLAGVVRGPHVTHAPTIWVAPGEEPPSRGGGGGGGDNASQTATGSHPAAAASPEPQWSHPPRPASALPHQSLHHEAYTIQPGSASAVRRRLDRQLKATPLLQLAATPSFRLTDGQREGMESWYAQHYARLTPTLDQPDGAYRMEAATRAIAASTLQTLASSNVDSINDRRAADYHGTSPLDAYVDALRYARVPSPQAAGPCGITITGSGDHGRPGGERQSRPSSAPSLSTGADRRGGSGPQWLQGSSFEVAMKQRPPVHVQPPPSGFLTSD